MSTPKIHVLIDFVGAIEINAKYSFCVDISIMVVPKDIPVLNILDGDVTYTILVVTTCPNEYK
jgi:hypothetical protein